MRALVTGVAGFIGSMLAEALVDRGDEVLGVDCLTPYYGEQDKRANMRPLLDSDRFTFQPADLRDCDLAPLLEGADVVFHLAAQPGVRLSWADFDEYASCNILATQRLLDAAKSRELRRLVYASSSSVYGNAAAYPTAETAGTCPHSPYGVTKLAAEHLCMAYAANWGVPTVSLRYFTVYGPRQRPDMAMHRLIAAAIGREAFPLYGSGEQVRDFTFVADVVRATIRAGDADVPPGTVLNVAGGSSISMNDLVVLVGAICGAAVDVVRLPGQAGDVRRTGGTTTRARELLGWQPEIDLVSGVTEQLAWHRSRERPSEIIRLT